MLRSFFCCFCRDNNNNSDFGRRCFSFIHPVYLLVVSISFTQKLDFHHCISFLLNFLCLFIFHLPLLLMRMRVRVWSTFVSHFSSVLHHLSVNGIEKEFNKIKLVRWLEFTNATIEDQREKMCMQCVRACVRYDSTKNLPDSN